MTVAIVPIKASARYVVGATPQQTFPIPFPYDEPGDVAVFVNGSPVLWTVVGGVQDEGIREGAAARLLSAVANCEVAVLRSTALRQDAVFPPSGAFRVPVLNRELSRLWMALQDMLARAGNVIARPDAEAADAAMVLPARAIRANKFFAFDANGQPVAVSAGDQSAQTVTPGLTGAVARSQAAAAADFINAKQFGAVGDGVTDDTAAIQAALDTGRNVLLGRGDWRTSSPLLLKFSRQSLRGAGRWATRILSSATGSAVLAANTGLSYLDVGGFTLGRTTGTVPGAGADGLSFAGTYTNCEISDIASVGNFHGFRLGSTDYSIVKDCLAQLNYGDGFRLANAGSAACQWYLDGCLAEKNDGSGLVLQAVAVGGATACSIGDMVGFRTFANSGYGAAFLGLPAVPIHGVRLIDCFLGEDGNTELHLDTHGGLHMVTGGLIELSGARTTGRTLSTPASGVGNGVRATNSNTDLTLTGVRIDGTAGSGVHTSAGATGISGGRITASGRALQPGTRSGVQHTGAGTLLVTGASLRGGGPGGSQEYGVHTADGNKCAVVGCDLDGNGVAPFLCSAGENGLTFVGNLPVGSNNLLPGAMGLGGAAPTGANSLNIAGANGVMKNGVPYAHP